GGALGIYAKLRTPPLQVVDFSTGEIAVQGKLSERESVIEARRLRYKLQDASRRILYSFHGDNVPLDTKGREKHHRTCNCNRSIVSPTVQIVKSSKHNKAFFSGVATCANARVCPVCAAPINERKANEMRTAANQRDALGVHFSLLTFTAPHNSGDKIEDLIPKISSALQSFWRGNPAKKFKDRYGIIGNIRSFEVRYGSNGWHPHFHIIVVSRSQLPVTFRDSNRKPLPLDSQSDDWQWVLSRWQNMCVNSGLDCPNEYGLDIQGGNEAGEYITKFGGDGEILQTKSGKSVTWDMMDEVTKGNVKSGRNGSLSPWDLLALSVDAPTLDERNKAKSLFLFYSRAMKGVTQIKWSRGLRDFFGLGAELTDEEILAKEEDTADLLCHITPIEWRYVIGNGLRPVLVEIAENGGSEAVARFLFSVTAKGDFDVYYRHFLNRSNTHNQLQDENISRVITTLSDGVFTTSIKPVSYV
ncbi:protein rep, partial [Vibrio anguillarum]|uniref:protein rep n=1 Tax=Vibrio anguillarum TaxID=55601 RepID=UPI0018FF0AAC